MRFFDKQRPQVYIHKANLKRDKKTGKRYWFFMLIVTFTVEHAEACDTAIAKAWQYITEQDSAACELLLIGGVQGCVIDFFAQIDDASPVLHIEGVDLVDLRMTRDGNTVEFWFSGQHENVGGIHDFMKPYAYQRLWAAFTPAQGELPMDGPEETAVYGSEEDPLFEDAVRIVYEVGKASTPALQRRLRIGYGRASHLIDLMERAKLVGPADGSKPREILLKNSVLPALDHMTEAVREGGVTSMSLQIPGQKPVVIDREGAERIHAAANKLKKSKRSKDPG